MEFHYHEVQTVELTEGGGSGFKGKTLTLDRKELQTTAIADSRVIDIKLDVISPGDRTRVANVLDVWDARRAESGPTFPGLEGPPVRAERNRRTHIFDGFQIVGCSRLPVGEGGLVVAHPKLLDFWGEGSRWTPLSERNSLVIDVQLDPLLVDKEEAGNAFRDVMMRISIAIGNLAISSNTKGQIKNVGRIADYEQDEHDLPRVSYVYQVQSQGPLLDTFLYGKSLQGLYPTLIDPIEVMDGALVSGNRGRMSTPTILHCRNPIIERLVSENGKSIRLLPIVLMEGHHKSVVEKERSADHAGALLEYLQADGAIFTQEGSGGMSMVDQMLAIETAVDAGIKSVAITYESGGSEGSDYPLLHHTPKAEHFVSVGNREAMIELERPDRLLGTAGAKKVVNDGVAQYNIDQIHENVTVPLFAFIGGVSQVGAARTQGFAV